MIGVFHKDLYNRWLKMSINSQMANIGAEVGRAINWKNKNNDEMKRNSFYRALELIDFSIEDPKNKKKLREFLRTRELLVDYFAGNNEYSSTDEIWNKYFYSFNFSVRNR